MHIVKEHYYDLEIGEYINICMVDMDPGIYEQVSQNHDGTYLILLNTRCSDEQQSEGFQHARQHIINGDWQKYYVQDIEMEAHDLSVRPEPADEAPADVDIPEEAEVQEPTYVPNWILIERPEPQPQKRQPKKKKKRVSEYETYLKEKKARAKILAKFGLEEVTVIVDGDYGEPVAKTVVRKMGW